MKQRFEQTFRFHRTKKEQFIWTDDEKYKIIFHSPQIQTFDYAMPIHEKNDILYYYYDMELWTKSDDEQWKLFASAWAHDCPAIRHLIERIDELIRSSMQTGTERFPNGSGGLTYRKSLSTFHAWSEDFYDIRRVCDTWEWYEMYIGAYDKALAIHGLCEQDIWELYECVKAFYEYSCEEYNAEIALFLESLRKTFRCQDGMLCERELDDNNQPTGTILKSYSIGDKLIIRALQKGNPQRRSARMYGMLTEVREHEIVLSATCRLVGGKSEYFEGNPENIPVSWILEVEEQKKK